MNQLFEHIDHQEFIRELQTLKGEHLAIAYHADADGCISAALIGSIFDRKNTRYFSVSTEDLSLVSLIDFTKKNKVTNLIMLDVNVFSQLGSLESLAKTVPGTVIVIDDHLGLSSSIPNNVRLLELLPPSDRKERKDQIRPAFLFAAEFLEHYSGTRKGFEDFLVLAGLFGEGVRHLFSPKAFDIAKKLKVLHALLVEA